MEGKINGSDFYQLEKDHFHVLEHNTLVPNDLDTGDILLFSRRCSDMNLIGAVLCYVAQVKEYVVRIIGSSTLLGTTFVLL